MVPLTKGQQDPELSMGSALVSCIWHRKPKQAFLMWKGKLVLFFFFFITHFFGVHVVCRSTFCPQDARRFSPFLFVSIARMVIVRTKR